MNSRSAEIREGELGILGEAARAKGEALLARLEEGNRWRSISLLVLMEPMAQPRPRFKVIRKGKFYTVHTYDPPEADEWKEEFGERVGRMLPDGFPAGGPVELHACAFRPIPADYSLGLRYLCEAGLVRPEKRPDADNYVKAVKDALSGWAWRDDSQVTLASCEKFYSARPRVEMTIRYRARPMDRIEKKKKKADATGGEDG